ncbi:MAG: hypothetical protein HOV87_00015 [Catenulispora sp.]|nr:hypothetical protein [Catenulispora sp.]
MRSVRFTTDPERTGEMLGRRGELIEATRERFEGLVETRLTRVGADTWIDHWLWESAEQMQHAIENVATIPGAQEAFAVIGNPIPEVAEIVDEHSGWEQ